MKLRRCGHERTPENDYIRSDGYTVCKICKTERNRAYREAHPEYFRDYQKTYRGRERRERSRSVPEFGVCLLAKVFG